MTKSQTNPIRTNLPASITAQFCNAEILTAQIKAVATQLVDLMEELHGGTCRLDISHEAGAELILLRPRVKLARIAPVDKSNNGDN